MRVGPFRAAWAAVLLAVAPLSGALAQGQPFAPAVIVNGQGITNWQVAQRARFLELLNAPDPTFEAAETRLVDETLQIQAARAAGVTLSSEELDAGMVEFAARGGLEPEQFIALLEQNGVAGETFRDFVRNGLLWRSFVQGRFGRLARPSDEQVQSAAARGGGGTDQVRVLLSEIAIPKTPETADAVATLAQRVADQTRGEAAFADAARRLSRAPSAPRGGRLDWVPLSQLPPRVSGQLLSLAPGEVSEPVDFGNFIALFLLRDLDDSAVTGPAIESIEWAEFLIAGGRTPVALATAARVDAVADTCDDLYGVAQGAPASALRRETAAPGALPADLAQVLAGLDAGEISTLLTEGANLRLVMLCARNPVTGEQEPEAIFQATGQALLTQRLTSYAEGYMAELRADAIIEDG